MRAEIAEMMFGEDIGCGKMVAMMSIRVASHRGLQAMMLEYGMDELDCCDHKRSFPMTAVKSGELPCPELQHITPRAGPIHSSRDYLSQYQTL